MAWTYVYGNYISYASGDHTVYIRNFLGYEVVTNNDTTYSVKFYSGFNWYTSAGTSKLYHISQNVTGTGQSAKSGSSSTTYTINTTSTAHAIIGAWTWSWNKSASASNKTITVTGSFTTSASTKSPPLITKTITVPALPKYTITYDGNGGTPASTTQTKTYGVNINLLSGSSFTRNSYQPIRYTVPNWGTTYLLGQSYTSNANLSLKVLWQADYTITYNANNGIGAPAAQAKPYNIDTALSNTVPTRENYVFLGWSTSASATTAVYQPGDTFSDNNNIILYAVWKLDKVQRNVFKLDASKNYIVTQEYIPTLPSREVRGNSVPGNFAFLGWFLERPSTIIYPVGTTAESIGALTEINADMSDTFYAVYVDDSPSELYKIYDGSVVSNTTDPADIVGEFNDYIDAITNNKFYDNAAPYGADDVHALFGYIQCNQPVHLTNLSGTINNCYGGEQESEAISATPTTTPTDFQMTAQPALFSYFIIRCSLDVVFLFVSGISKTESQTFTFIENSVTYSRTLTIQYDGINTLTYSVNEAIPEEVLFRIFGIAYDVVDTSSYIDIIIRPASSSTYPRGFYRDIKQVEDYIFYCVYNPAITTSSKHTITITGIDSQNKAVSFTVENKIKLPLIDIHEWGDDLQGRKVIDINSDVSVLRMIGKSSSSHSDIYVASPNRMGCLAVNQNIFGLYDNTNTNWLIKRAAGNSYVSIPSDLRLNNHTGQIGEVIDVRNTAAKTASSGTWYTCCSIKLDPGIWVISAFANWSNATQTGGTYAMGISESSTGGPWHNSIQAPTSTGINVQLHLTHLVDPDTTTTYYLRMRHSTGSSSNPGTCTIPVGNINYSNCMRAIRIQ